MVPDPSTAVSNPSTDSPSQQEETSSTAANVLIGGIAGILLGFIPFSPVLGGAITGYLEGGPANQAVKAGAMAGAIMLIPFFFLGLLYLVFILGIGDATFAFGIVGFFIIIIGGIYTIGLSALGGYLGTYLKDEL